jgi:hypothetical protein
MRTRVETCTDGVAAIVPEALAAQTWLRGGGLSTSTTLADLLAGIAPDNLHSEWAVGPPVGAELL